MLKLLSERQKMLSEKGACRWILAMICFVLLKFAELKIPQEEVDALQEIATTMGASSWKFNPDSCEVEMVVKTQPPPKGSESSVGCDCTIPNDSFCHITSIILKSYSLAGVLPRGLGKLPYIKTIDLAYNYLNGTIPKEWASTQLNVISLLVNQLSGEIPKELGNITSLTQISFEANQLSGTVPSELGKLVNLKSLVLSSNKLTGKLPTSLSELTNLTDFRVNDNNFSGSIPDFIQNWRELTRLEMIASGLTGPIPSNISLLIKLTDLRITDINGPTQKFPELSNSTGLLRLVLRSCNIFGEIPEYVWIMTALETLDVSFNRLVGEIPDNVNTRTLKLVFVTGNMLSGSIPDSILRDGSSIDLSYNNFTWQGPEQPACRSNMNLYVNLFRSSSMTNTLRNFLPCLKEFTCPKYGCSMHVNSGGYDYTAEENNRKVTFEGDADVDGGTARYYREGDKSWGFSSTGDFMDDNNYQNARFVATAPPTNLSELYTTARLSPLSLTYFRYCIDNGSYTVSLHFAEILFTNDNTFRNLGRRIFDIYIQNKLVWKDFNIEDEAHGAQRPVVKQFNASVDDNTLEIRFQWNGKGTTRIPNRGIYGPLISAISVNPSFKSCSDGNKKNLTIYVIIGVIAACMIFFTFGGILWWKRWLCRSSRKRKELEGLELQMISFTLKQMKNATKNFDNSNKIGEGGFGPVYKGILPDGMVVAVKQLSPKSGQGNREFINEIAMISCSQHPNLVKLHGCCIEGNQLLLVYEYMENNSLANALFSSEDCQLVLDWATRFNICIGVARGLAFLHEETKLKIVHRDIKATNVLLDKNLNPKISDFGLAKLHEDDKSHISTRIAGTIGYMAPEYALWGYLTNKADVYSFGIVALEIVSGKNNNNYMPSANFICLLDWALNLQQSGTFDDFLDKRLGGQINKEEAERVLKIALLCTSVSPSVRPIMSEVVSMLEGRNPIPDVSQVMKTDHNEDIRFRAMSGFHEDMQNQSLSGSLTPNSSRSRTFMGSSSTSNFNRSDSSPGTKL